MTDTDHLSGDDWKKLYPALYPPDELDSATTNTGQLPVPVMVHAATPSGIPVCVWARHEDRGGSRSYPETRQTLSVEYRHRIVNRVEIGQINCPECKRLVR